MLSLTLDYMVKDGSLGFLVFYIGSVYIISISKAVEHLSDF